MSKQEILVAMIDVHAGDLLDGRIVRNVTSIDQYVVVDSSDSHPLVRKWYHKVYVLR